MIEYLKTEKDAAEENFNDQADRMRKLEALGQQRLDSLDTFLPTVEDPKIQSTINLVVNDIKTITGQITEIRHAFKN